MAQFNKGSNSFQVVEIFKHSGINQIDEKKHELKSEAREKLASEGKSDDWHNVAKEFGITGSTTATKYLKIWVEIAKYSKAEFGLKNIENIKNKHIEAFLTDKVQNGVSRNYFQTLVAAIEKFETALSWTAGKYATGKQYHFTSPLDKVKVLAYESFGDLKTYNRAYVNPQQIIDNIRGQNYQIAATFQLTGGFRIAECTNLLPEQFKGIVTHPITGEKCGQIEIKSDDAKGGKIHPAYVPVNEYNQAKSIANEKGEFRVDHSTYRDRIKEVAPDYVSKDGISKASHGLRWNFAQDMFQKCISSGLNYEQSLKSVSNLMAHERISITEWYTNGGRK